MNKTFSYLLIDPTVDQPKKRPGKDKDLGGYWRPGANPTVDVAAVSKGEYVLLIQRSETSEVFAGWWALPGGFHDTRAPRGKRWRPGLEDAVGAACRELREETGLMADPQKMQHIGLFASPDRDPRNNSRAWSISNAFRLDLDDLPPVQGMDDAAAARWVPLSDLAGMDLAFDHREILRRTGLPV